MKRYIRRKLEPIKSDPDHDRKMVEALKRLRQKMALFDSLPKAVRDVLTTVKVGGSLEDLQHIQCMVLYDGKTPEQIAQQLLNITDDASARRFKAEQLDLEQRPIKWILKKAPV
jgi:hypothetical protein